MENPTQMTNDNDIRSCHFMYKRENTERKINRLEVKKILT